MASLLNVDLSQVFKAPSAQGHQLHYIEATTEVMMSLLNAQPERQDVH